MIHLYCTALTCHLEHYRDYRNWQYRSIHFPPLPALRSFAFCLHTVLRTEPWFTETILHILASNSKSLTKFDPTPLEDINITYYAMEYYQPSEIDATFLRAVENSLLSHPAPPRVCWSLQFGTCDAEHRKSLTTNFTDLIQQTAPQLHAFGELLVEKDVPYDSDTSSIFLEA